MQHFSSSCSIKRVFKKFHPKLVRFAYRLVRDHHAAEDIVSDVFCANPAGEPPIRSPTSSPSSSYFPKLPY